MINQKNVVGLLCSIRRLRYVDFFNSTLPKDSSSDNYLWLVFQIFIQNKRITTVMDNLILVFSKIVSLFQ
jgi:hypothetical protein